MALAVQIAGFLPQLIITSHAVNTNELAVPLVNGMIITSRHGQRRRSPQYRRHVSKNFAVGTHEVSARSALHMDIDASTGKKHAGFATLYFMKVFFTSYAAQDEIHMGMLGVFIRSSLYTVHGHAERQCAYIHAAFFGHN